MEQNEASEQDKKNDGGAIATLASNVQGMMLNEQSLAVFEEQVKLRQRMLMVCVKATKPHDWIDFNDKPYLEGEGAERIAAVFGIAMGRPEITRTRKPNGHLYVEAIGEFTAGNRTIIEMGDCSSDDRFFCRNQYIDKEKQLLPQNPEDVNDADVVKKAIQNLRSRGISTFIGIKGLSWSDLVALGLTREGAGAKVDFKKGKQGGSTKTGAQKNADAQKSNDDWAKTEELLNELKELMATADAHGVDEVQFVQHISYFKATSGKEYVSNSWDELESGIREKTTKFGLQKALFPMVNKAKEMVEAAKKGEV